MKRRMHASMALLLNLLLVVLEGIGLYQSCVYTNGSIFVYYTQDSNVLALLGALPMLFYQARALTAGSAIPKWAQRLKYISVCCVSVTFLVVLLVLVPMEGISSIRQMFLDGPMLYMHLLCPLLTFADFICFEDLNGLCLKDARIALIPTILYALIMLVLNIVRVVEGPYPFLHVYEQPIWASVLWIFIIVGGAGLIARGVLALHRRKWRY